MKITSRSVQTQPKWSHYYTNFCNWFRIPMRAVSLECKSDSMSGGKAEGNIQCLPWSVVSGLPLGMPKSAHNNSRINTEAESPNHLWCCDAVLHPRLRFASGIPMQMHFAIPDPDELQAHYTPSTVICGARNSPNVQQNQQHLRK